MRSGHDLGEICCDAGIRVRFGGGSIGVMGALGSSVLSHGGYLTAIIPEELRAREQPISGDHGQLGDRYELIVTSDMYERKRNFRYITDPKTGRKRWTNGFVVLGGGAGTRDELWEELTGLQIGYHDVGLVLVNTRDCFRHVLADIALMREQQFVRQDLEFRDRFAVVNTVQEVVPAFKRMYGLTNVFSIAARQAAS